MPAQSAHPSSAGTETKRSTLLKQLFPQGVPTLWCPLLTHYHSAGGIDSGRIAAHLQHLAPNVKGFLIPGSTGDAWELEEPEYWQLLEFALREAERLQCYLLIGVLKASASDTLEMSQRTIARIQSWINEKDPATAFLKGRVCGLVVCAPTGTQVSQEEMGRGLRAILELSVPTALYQLPQVTQNEMSPELVCELAQQFPNLIFFKDSSGKDRVVSSARNLSGVFTVRGAEGDYARWFNFSPQGYNGFLLSTANCFSAELRAMLNYISEGRLQEATPISETLTQVIHQVFKLVEDIPQGNPFANANKAIDQCLAYGLAAEAHPPRLHGGSFLPVEVIRHTQQLLQRHHLLPSNGYLHALDP